MRRAAGMAAGFVALGAALVATAVPAAAQAVLPVTLTTVATPGPVLLGQPIQDTATVFRGAVPGNPAPTGTVTFNLYGPNDPTCAAAPVFVSAFQPIGGGPPPTATSGDFTPLVAGTYLWVASYSGDANYLPATTACGDAGETSIVVPYPLAVSSPGPALAAAGPIPFPAADTKSGFPPGSLAVGAAALLVQALMAFVVIRRPARRRGPLGQ
jgi:hypothetical protein